jgi:hypothetical protein
MPFDFVKGLLSEKKKPLPPRRAYWHHVPLRRLTFLLLAIFLLFGMIGSFVDLLDQGQKPVVPVVVWSLFSGLIAVVWILAFFRSRRGLIGTIALWLLGSFVISKLLQYMGPYTQPTPEQGTRGATIACMVLSFGAYVFFMRFIENEGTRAVRMQTELAIAQGIQQTLVPPIEFRSDHLEIYGISIPSAEVGGDLVDVVPLPDGSVFAYVADVSGHGLSAGILMGMIKTAVRTQLFDLPSPTAVFERLNQVLPAVKESHMYATCTALRIHPENSGTCRVDYAIAGQPAMLHASGTRVSQLSDQQLPIGLLADAQYEDHSLEFKLGYTLLVATDGILEAADKSGVEFGLDRLESVLRDNSNAPLSAIAGEIQAALSSYRQDDDQSLLLVRFAQS